MAIEVFMKVAAAPRHILTRNSKEEQLIGRCGATTDLSLKMLQETDVEVLRLSSPDSLRMTTY